MDTFRIDDLRMLTASQNGPCVTIFMPTHVAGANGQQDPVRLKNLLHQAEEQLAKHWLRAPEARDLLQPARLLPDDTVFWQKRNRGLALFVSPQGFHRFRLPLNLHETAIVNQRFHVKPLLPLLNEEGRFYVLSLSQNRVRLFTATQNWIEEVPVPGMPDNMKEALNIDGADRGSQAHSATHGRLGKQAAVFHGHGGERDTRKDDIETYFRIVGSALHPYLREQRMPMLLAGVEFLLPIYREVSGYRHLAVQQLVGNCDYLSPHEIHEQAWPLMEPTFRQSRDSALAKYRQLAGTGKTSDDIRQITPAAHQGKVDTLFLNPHAQQWGAYDSESGAVHLHDQASPHNDDLIDLAAVQTVLTRGTVYALPSDEQTNGANALAVYRY